MCRRASGSIQPSLRSDSGTAETADREGQGKAGKRARQQSRIWAAAERGQVRRDPEPDRHANAGRSGRLGIAKVWKEPAFFLAHPRAIAAFGRECTRRGVPPPTVTLFGSPFVTWRGLPLIPCDKLRISDAGTTNILLLRTGEKKQGVVGLLQPGIPGEVAPSLSVRFMGINRKAIASYLISLYCSLAVLTHDALGVLENVEIDKYHEYPFNYA